MTWLTAPGIRRTILLCCALLIAANALFLLVRLGDSVVPKWRVADALREAFYEGSATTADYPLDMMEGRDQYTDCVTFQLTLLGNAGLLKNALAPRLLSVEGVVDGVVQKADRCRQVKNYLDGRIPDDQNFTYTRFWHGQASLAAAALTVMPLDGYRSLLFMTTLALMALTAILAALNDPKLFAGLAPLIVLSFILGGQMGYGQHISYAPAQIACWAMAAFLIAARERLTGRHIVLLAVLAGCLEGFLDQMISIPLVAGIFLIVAAAVSMPRWQSQPLFTVVGESASLGVAWAFGLVGTYIAKLTLTTTVLGWHTVVGSFLEQLRFRTGTVDPLGGLHAGESSWLGLIGRNIHRLASHLWLLGYTDKQKAAISAVIAAFALVGWLWAVWRLLRALRDGHARATLVNGAGYIAASLFLLAWVAVFPEHTWRHAPIAVRAAILWVVAGWGWALTDYATNPRWKVRVSPA